MSRIVPCFQDISSLIFLGLKQMLNFCYVMLYGNFTVYHFPCFCCVDVKKLLPSGKQIYQQK